MDITLGDLADIEDATGEALTEKSLKNPPMKVALAILWILKRKENPAFTYEQARNLPINEPKALTDTLKQNPTLAPPGIPEEAGPQPSNG